MGVSGGARDSAFGGGGLGAASAGFARSVGAFSAVSTPFVGGGDAAGFGTLGVFGGARDSWPTPRRGELGPHSPHA